MRSRPSEVQIGSVWRRLDPSGSFEEFEVTAITAGPVSTKTATGRTPGGKRIKCQVHQMIRNADRFVFVHDLRVRESA